MVQLKKVALVGLVASAEAFTIGGPAMRPQAVVSRCSVAPEMGLGTFVKKILKRPESSEVTSFRSQLAGMDSLSGLSEMSLEREEGREVCASPSGQPHFHAVPFPLPLLLPHALSLFQARGCLSAHIRDPTSHVSLPFLWYAGAQGG